MPVTNPTLYTFKTRMAAGGLFISLALLLIAGAWALPFLFESPSMFYKFGFQKALLRGGKGVGLTAAVLLFFQILLASRFKFMDRIFALNRLYFFHRINGIALSLLALAHPILIIAAENFTLFPFEKRYWPEILGVGLLFFILALAVAANWRTSFGFAYNSWARGHRLGVIPVIMLVPVHILFVSATFQAGLPRAAIIGIAALNMLLILRIWYRRLFPGRGKLVVTRVEPAGKEAFAVDVETGPGQFFTYLPGQFAFITPVSAGLPKETHPFTLSSSPSEPGRLQFIVRARGDWTAKIGALAPGEAVYIDGPYGRFSYLAYPGSDPLIMIAGGIGITPMLSMLRHLADRQDRRQILLIWSNRTEEYIVRPEEFKRLSRRLSGLRIRHVLSRKSGSDQPTGRLNRRRLEQMLAGHSRKSRVYICGPHRMMKDISRALKKIGFLPARVYKEEFRL